MELPPPELVLDTNVNVVLYTLCNLLDSIDKGEEPKRQAWRRNQAQEALYLGIYLDRESANTLLVPRETIRMILKVSPREPTIKHAYTWLFMNFVRPKVLPGWHDSGDLTKFLKGNAADRELVRLAQEHRIPLVTFEGHTEDGIVDQGYLRKRAKAADVTVYTPGEYLRQRARRDLTNVDVDRFFARYERGAPGFELGQLDYPAKQKHLAGLLSTLKNLIDR